MTQRKNLRHLLLIGLLIATNYSYAQFTQRLRGTITDQLLQKPIAGITVSLPNLNKTVLTDSSGIFRFADVPVGTQQLRISHVGYKEISIDNVVVNAGKEVVLTIALENTIRNEEEVIVKNQPGAYILFFRYFLYEVSNQTRRLMHCHILMQKLR